MEVCTCSGCHGNLRLPRGWPLPQSPMKPGTQEWGHTHTHSGLCKVIPESATSFLSLLSTSLGKKRMSRRGREWRPAQGERAAQVCWCRGTYAVCLGWCVSVYSADPPPSRSQTTQERDLGGRWLLTKTTIITVNLNWELIKSQLCDCGEHFTGSVSFDPHNNCTR